MVCRVGSNPTGVAIHLNTMKTFFATLVSVIIVLSSFINFNEKNDESVCPTPATIVEEQWETASIYEISFIDQVPTFRDKEILLSGELEDTFARIMCFDNIAFGDIDIEVLYIEDEDVYIANATVNVDDLVLVGF